MNILLIWKLSCDVIVTGWLWFWKHLFECISLVLACVIVGLVGYTDKLSQDMQAEEKAFHAYKVEQKILSDAQVAAHQRKLEDAKEQHIAKVLALNRANDRLTANVARLSGVLRATDKRYANATEAARLEYTTAVETVSRQCIGEYSRMAQIADGHANDAELMRNAWPIKKPP